VERELESLFGTDGFYRWGERAFMRVEGGAVIFLVVTPLREDALLNVRCYLVRDVERPDAELGNYLAHLNADQIFGAFSIDEDSDVCFDYTILGSAVTPEVISLTIGVVAQAAAQYAPEIIARWGGITSLDRLRRELEAGEEEPEPEEPLN
jgi:hypothetical protein